MPIYEYFCPRCEVRFELMRPISQASEDASCSECQSQAGRVLSGFACRTRSASGAVTSVAGTGSSCNSCAATTCSSCQ